MNWRDLYPEGSTVFIGRERYEARHNEYDLGLDLFDSRNEFAMTIAPEFVSKIASGIKYPEFKIVVRPAPMNARYMK